MASHDVLDAREAAEYLRLNEQTVRRLARTREIPAFKVGGAWRFKKSTLDRWASSQEFSQHKKTVLVVDDEAAIVELIQQVLQSDDLRVLAASKGDQAIELAKQANPDLVLLDLKMPGMDGPSCLAQLRNLLGPVPVIIMTGYPDGDLMQRALEHAPITLLSKPLRSDRINETVRNILGIK